MRSIGFWLLALLTGIWCLFGLLETIDLLGTDCAAASSEVSDPCAVGRTTYFFFGFAFWLVVAVPLSIATYVVRPQKPSID